MKAVLEFDNAMLGVPDKDVSQYQCQYISDDYVIEALRFDTVCEDCELIMREPDINSVDCPVGMDYTSIHCVRAGKYLYVKRYLMYADLLLRNTLGDIWHDKYSA